MTACTMLRTKTRTINPGRERIKVMTDILTRMRRERRIALALFLVLVALALLAGFAAPRPEAGGNGANHAAITVQ